MKELKVHRKGGKHHNLNRSKHNEDTKKYDKQAGRTANNKARNIKKAKRLKDAADKRKNDVAHCSGNESC